MNSYKKIILLVVTILFGFVGTSEAQLRKIPVAVTKAFKDKFPDADDVEWKDKITVFQATFDEGNMIARFTSSGEWKSTEEIIDESDIPDEVENGFKKSKYADWEIKQVSTISEPDQSIKYKLVVNGASIIERKALLFSEDGQLLKDGFKF